jgi:ribosomal protein S18 acetylase RimI-like enzyme
MVYLGPIGESPTLSEHQFREFVKNLEGIDLISPIDEDDELDLEILGQAEVLMDQVGIIVLRGKELQQVAITNDKVVGALFTEWEGNEFSFDVGVNPDFQGRGIGNRLIQVAIETYQFDKEAFPGAKMVIDVVNPRLADHLQSKFGFREEGREPGHIIMVRK